MSFKNKKKFYTAKVGVGLNNLKRMYAYAGVNFNKSIVNIKSKQQKKLHFSVNKVTHNDSLRIKIRSAISLYTKLKNYRGFRHILKLPARGQRTHTNAKTVKRLRKKIVYAKKEISKKKTKTR
jgi:small subunit ribosomal protein S13